jgi:hypothetical protein
MLLSNLYYPFESYSLGTPIDAFWLVIDYLFLFEIDTNNFRLFLSKLSISFPSAVNLDLIPLIYVSVSIFHPSLSISLSLINNESLLFVPF